MSRHIKQLIILVVAGVACLSSVIVFTRFKMPKITGTWKDVSSEYYVVFYADGTYVESTYNIPCAYTVDYENRILTLDSVDESVSTTTLVPTIDRSITVLINDSMHTLKPVRYSPRLYTWGSEIDSKITGVYNMSDSFSEDVELILYDDYCFEYSIGSTSVTGKYAHSRRGGIMLLTDGGSTVEYLSSTANGFAMGPVDSDLRSSTAKENVIEDSRLSLSGTVYDQYTDTTYTFDDSGFAERTDSDGITVEFMYHVDLNGDVVMVDSVGYGATIEMWYNSASSTMYRYTLDRDTWTDYLITSGEVGGNDT